MKRAGMLRLSALRGRLFTLFVDEKSESAEQGVLDASLPDRTDLAPGSSTCRHCVTQPMVRKGYYENRAHSDITKRGQEPFVAVGWDEALDMVAEAIARARPERINRGIVDSSSWAPSIARFHDSQKQLQRFLRCFEDHSAFAGTKASTISPRAGVLASFGGGAFEAAMATLSTESLVSCCKRIVFFGGAVDQSQMPVSRRHDLLNASKHIGAIARADIPIVMVSPERDVVDSRLRPCWLQCRPETEVAVILGIIHTLIDEELHDQDFLAKYCVGFDALRRYVMGESDHVPKTPSWAQTKSGVPASEILMLARLMAADRCLISLSKSLLNSEHGQDTYRAAIALACALGYIGQDGGGLVSVVIETSKMHSLMDSFSRNGDDYRADQGTAVQSGETAGGPIESSSSSGAQLASADWEILYLTQRSSHSCLGNLDRFCASRSNLRSIIVHDSEWSRAAHFADIVLPCTSSLDRTDLISEGRTLRFSQPSRPSTRPQTDTFDDYEIFSSLAGRLGFAHQFTGGKSSADWLRYFYDSAKQTSDEQGSPLPDFEDFKLGLQIGLSSVEPDKTPVLEHFRVNPVAFPLSTLSGKIEIQAERAPDPDRLAGEEHLLWRDRDTSIGAIPAAARFFQLVSDEPLHGFQPFYSFGAAPPGSNIHMSQAVRINLDDARILGIVSGDIVSLISARGAFLAEAFLSAEISKGKLLVGSGAPRSGNSVSRITNKISPLDFSGFDRTSHSQPLSGKVFLYSCTVNIKKYSGPVMAAVELSPPTILYNVSPTAFRFASRR